MMARTNQISAVIASTYPIPSRHQRGYGFRYTQHLSPGSRVPERELCERFKISRTPLREALTVLAAEGLVDLWPNRGGRVRQFSEADIRNLFEMISGLDFVAGRMACARITDEQIAAIEKLHLEMYTHYLRRELADYFRLNQKIHQGIIDAAANPLLSENYAKLNSAVRRLRYSANLVRRDGSAKRCGSTSRSSTRYGDATPTSSAC